MLKKQAMYRNAETCEDLMYNIYISNTAYKKRACELKVCSGWFGLRERKVHCEKASVATAARQADNV